MLVQKEKLQHINTITHEGKIILLGTDADGKIWYSIKQAGFEDSYLNQSPEARTGWENWQELKFSNQEPDRSIIEQEAQELTYGDNADKYIYRSRYATQDQTAVVPVQLISAFGHLYVFRQSKENTLFVDRFVLDSLANKLVGKLQVRHKRSGNKHLSAGHSHTSDSLDYRDAEGKLFFEPTIELSLVNNLHQGWFTVVLVPTDESDRHYWHIFAYNSSSKKIEITSIPASAEGLFDVRDYTRLEAIATEGTRKAKQTPGIICRTLEIDNLSVANGLAATKYHVQLERETPIGDQLMKEATRVMLAIPTVQGNIAAMSFAVANNGTLSQIAQKADSEEELHRSTQKILLPLNNLDEIKGIGKTEPPPQGIIEAIQEYNDQNKENKIKITSTAASQLKDGDYVKIQGTRHYNGHYQIKKIDDNTFEVEVTQPQNETAEDGNNNNNSSIGSWKVVPEAELDWLAGGAISGYQTSDNSKLKIIAPNHGLKDGDEVQILDTTIYDGYTLINKIDDQNFTIEDYPWQAGEAVSLKYESQKRRGLIFEGEDDRIEISGVELKTPSFSYDYGYTYSAWIFVPVQGSGEQLIIVNDNSVQLLVNDGKVTWNCTLVDGSKQTIQDPNLITENQWIHYAGVVSYNDEKRQSSVSLYRNGQAVADLIAVKHKEIVELNTTERQNQDQFGISVAVGDKIAVIGAPKYDVEVIDSAGESRSGGGRPTSGRRTDPPRRTSHQEQDVGQVFIFQQLAQGWEKVATLSASDKSGGDQFGSAVASSGDGRIVAVGSILGDSSNGVRDTGSVYIYQQSGTDWQEQKLQAADGQQNHKFGAAISLTNDGNLIAIGASAAAGENAATGAVYLFQAQKDGTWSEQAKLLSPDGESGDEFGASVTISLDGETVVVGAPSKSSQQGKVYVFQKTESGDWSEQSLQPADPQTGDRFGYTVAVGENTIVVGAYGKYDNFGAVYIFSKQGNTWRETQKLQASNAEQRDHFGYFVALDGNRLIVGTEYIDVDGNCAYVFENKNGTWLEQKKITISANDYYYDEKTSVKSAVALFKDTAILGLQGVYDGQDQDDNLGSKAYVATLQNTNNSESTYHNVNLTIGSGFVGKIAEVQVWDTPRTNQEIKDTMYLQIPSEKAYLAGYWRMGAIAESEENQTPIVLDFSAQANHGIVKGDPYVGMITQNRTLADQSEVNKYSNDDVFPVLPGARYQESFEFKIDPVIDSKDGLYSDGYPLFYFNYWGKTSRTAQQKQIFEKDAGSPTFEALSNGWYRASYNFTVPTNLYFVRCFEIGDVFGNWNTISIRKHRIRLIAKTITKANYSDRIGALATLAAPETAVNSKLAQFQTIEEQEIAFLARQEQLSPEIQNQLSQVSNELIAAVQQQRLTRLGMQTLATDLQGLSTNGGLLEFVNAASRLSAIETYEGQVQLSYFDTAGQICQTLFDATVPQEAATATTSYALDFKQNNSAITLLNAIEINGEWTVETKFAYPFSVEQEWQVLTSFPSELEIVVHNRTALGIRFQGEFVNCGYDLTTLSAGWHNLSIVSQAQENLIIHFYIDGEEIGELSPPETPTSKALEFNNHSDDSEYQEDYVDLPSIDWDFSENGFTLEAWVYFENYTDKSTDDECNIIVLKDEEDNLIGLVIYDDGVNNNNLSFRVYTADNNSELIVPKCLELQKWLHLAVVINTEGKTCVYKNGTLIYYEEDFSIPSSVDRPFSYIGDNDLNAQISEVRLWTVVRSQEEIQQNMNKILKGDEPGLVNYWRLKDNSVRDYTANKQNGTVIGTPATVNNTSLKITTIANGSNGEEQFGKLAEFRVWNKALSSSEITANLAKKQLNGNEPNLLTYYTFNEGTGAQIYDRTGNGYDGSLQGETWEKVLTAIEPSQNYRKAEPEQWLLNSVRPICLNFNKDNSLIRLLKPIDMSGGWTIEGWFSHIHSETNWDNSLAKVLDLLNSNAENLSDTISNRFDFEEGESGTYIEDGGSRMFVGGNYLQTNLGGDIPYSNNAIISSSYLGRNGKYFTCKYTGLFIFAADLDGVDWFETYGRIEGDCKVNSFKLYSGRYIGFFKQTLVDNYPSVNHLIIVEKNESVEQEYDESDLASDKHRINNLSGVKRFYYLLFGSQNNYKMGNSEIQPIMDVFVQTLGMEAQEETDTQEEIDLSQLQSDHLPLKENHNKLNENYTAVTNSIPNCYQFSTHSEDGNHICSGGNGMFSCGNYIQGGKYYYSDKTQMSGSSPDLGANGNFFIHHYPGLFVYAAELDGVDTFTISGTLGFSGNCDGNKIEYNNYVGFVKRSWDSGSSHPSVNHLIIVENNNSEDEDEEVDHDFNEDEDDYHQISNLSGVKRLYYLLFAGSNGTYIDDATMQHIMETFLKTIGEDTLPMRALVGEHLVIANNSLGTIVDGVFQSSNYSLSRLAAGWHHVAAVGQGSGEEATTTFYIDGQKLTISTAEGEKPRSCNAKNTSPITTIGTLKDAAKSGKIAEVRVWNTALNDEEIAANSQNKLSGKEPGLVAYFPLNEGAGIQAKDYTGNGHDGIIQAASWSGCTAPFNTPKHSVISFELFDQHIHSGSNYVDSSTPINLNKTSFSVEFWVKRHPARLHVNQAVITHAVQNIHVLKDQDEEEQPKGVWLGFEDTDKFAFGLGNSELITDSSYLEMGWHHWACVYDSDRKIREIYRDGQLLAQDSAPLSEEYTGKGQFYIGSKEIQEQFVGYLSEVRLWNKALTKETIEANLHKRLADRSVNELQTMGLIGYWLLNRLHTLPNSQQHAVYNRISNRLNPIYGAFTIRQDALPLIGNAVLSTEYSSILTDSRTGESGAVARRLLAIETINGVNVLPAQRIEAIELKWIGNAELAPTLLGYIEGAPPVPSENLTLRADYSNATSVALDLSEDMKSSWNSAEDAPVSRWLLQSNPGTNTSDCKLNLNHKLSLRGTSETFVQFPELGKRFIPKNVGYALVASEVADVYITRLARSRKMIDCQIIPSQNTPAQIQTLTFPINANYTMNGSLDGQTGHHVSSDRYFGHIPELRQQYGSLYPASYYHLEETLELQEKIEIQDKQREVYFENRNAHCLEMGTKAPRDLNSIVTAKKAEIDKKILNLREKQAVLNNLGRWQQHLENFKQVASKRNLVNRYVWNSESGFHLASQHLADIFENTIGGSLSLNAKLKEKGTISVSGLDPKSTLSLTQTLSKKQEQTAGFTITVDASGIETMGITDEENNALLPGEKVGRYDFLTFYLEGNTTNFYDFFNTVVNAEWLESNEKAARILRKVMLGKPNKTWRVLHRVTNVERPWGVGFGEEIRLLSSKEERPNTSQKIPPGGTKDNKVPPGGTKDKVPPGGTQDKVPPGGTQDKVPPRGQNQPPPGGQQAPPGRRP